jgi:hypothetical protein
MKRSTWFYESGLKDAGRRCHSCGVCCIDTKGGSKQFKRLLEFDNHGKAVKPSEPFREFEISSSFESANTAECGISSSAKTTLLAGIFPRSRDFTAVLTVVEHPGCRTSSLLALGVFRFQLPDLHSTFLQPILMPADTLNEFSRYPTKCRSELLWTIVCFIMERFLNSVYNAKSKPPDF